MKAIAKLLSRTSEQAVYAIELTLDSGAARRYRAMVFTDGRAFAIYSDVNGHRLKSRKMLDTCREAVEAERGSMI